MPRRASIGLNALALHLQAGGLQTAQGLAAAAKIDRSQVSRLVATSGGLIQQIGAARRSRYAWRRNVRSCGNCWPVYRVDEVGRAAELGQLEAFHGGWRVTWQDTPAWSRLVTDEDDWAEGMPFFCEDMRPQGFMGRLLAARLPQSMGLPPDPTNWSDDQVLHFLVTEGFDVPGNIVIGDAGVRRALAPSTDSDITDPAAQYPELAARALQGGVFGSSAAGEQQKFPARVQQGDEVHPVLVKFSPRMETPAGQRWADLLVAEELASNLLANVGEGQMGVRILDAAGRRFLEVPRFDRVSARGRRGTVSLTALQGSRVAAEAADWSAATEHLQNEGMVAATTVASVRRRQLFGELIGNSDMHFGNLTFFLGHSLPLQLAPAYDMLPMLWAPQGAEMVGRSFSPLPPSPRQAPDWSIAADWAASFWRQLASDPRISPGFADLARLSAEMVARLRHEFGDQPGEASRAKGVARRDGTKNRRE